MIERATWLNAVVLDVLGPVYSLAVILFLFICIIVYWSPLGRVRIGGASAKPLLVSGVGILLPLLLHWLSVFSCGVLLSHFIIYIAQPQH